MKILHVMHDDKHNDRIVKAFEGALPGASEYMALEKPGNIKFLTSPKIKVRNARMIAQKLVSEDFDIAIFHALDLQKLKILRSVPKKTKIVWIGWGFDYYSSLLKKSFNYPHGILDKLTVSKLSEMDLVSKVTIDGKDFLRRTQRFLLNQNYKRRDYEKIDVFVPVLKREWDLARKENPWFKPRYFEWNYSDEAPKIFGRMQDKTSILVGNSATITNNHFDAFHRIAELGKTISFEEIICPLSYGNKKIREMILKSGQYYFGKKFSPQTRFVGRDQYMEIFARCHTVVMNQVRQQGMGNINIAMQAGSRVVLNPRSIMVEELEDRGYKFGTIDEMGSLDNISDFQRVNDKALIRFWENRSSPVIIQRFVENVLNKRESGVS